MRNAQDGKSGGTESRSGVVRGWEEAVFWVQGSFWGDGNVLQSLWWLHNSVNTLKASELHTLNG